MYQAWSFMIDLKGEHHFPIRNTQAETPQAAIQKAKEQVAFRGSLGENDSMDYEMLANVYAKSIQEKW